MLLNIRNKFSHIDFLNQTKSSEKICKLSFFHKNIKSLKDKTFLMLHIKSSKNKYIYEIGGIVFKDGRVHEKIFQEYRVPFYELVKDKYTGLFVKSEINLDRPLFNHKDYEWLINLMNTVDYIIIDNLNNLFEPLFRFKKGQKEFFNIKLFNSFNKNKVICCYHTLSNSYFQKLGISPLFFRQDNLSNSFNWVYNIENEHIYCINEILKVNLSFRYPVNVFEQDKDDSFFKSVELLIMLLTFNNIKLNS